MKYHQTEQTTQLVISSLDKWELFHSMFRIRLCWLVSFICSERARKDCEVVAQFTALTQRLHSPESAITKTLWQPAYRAFSVDTAPCKPFLENLVSDLQGAWTVGGRWRVLEVAAFSMLKGLLACAGTGVWWWTPWFVRRAGKVRNFILRAVLVAASQSTGLLDGASPERFVLKFMIRS